MNRTFFHEEMATIDLREHGTEEVAPLIGPTPVSSVRLGGSAAEVKVFIDVLAFDDTIDLALPSCMFTGTLSII
jgi:hypothetical protein